uniref:Uncharacterized protein n=1 Tax=Shigella dysenteriae 1 TaxID=984897 RepID=A0A142CN76_SHIDY|nr:hypothetical protein [Shigella dysenteriae 1]
MSEIRFVTLESDFNNIKEIYSDDELNRLLEAVNQNCPTRIVLGSVEKGKKHHSSGVLEQYQSVFQLRKSMK